MATAEKGCYSSADSEDQQQVDAQKSTEEDEQQKYGTAENFFPEQCGNGFHSLHVDTLVVGTPKDSREIVSPCEEDEVEDKDVNQDFVAETGPSYNGDDVIFIIKHDDDVNEQDEEEEGEFRVGSTFDHYGKVVKAIQAYERRNHVRLYRRDSRTLSSIISRGRAPKKNFSMDLRYGELCYRCRHGGKKYKSFSTGKRPNQSSFKQGCEMHIRFGVSDDGTRLVVKSMSEDHNHEINEETIVKEALHPELCTYVSKLVWSDTNIGIDDVKKRLENYVCDEMFKDQTPPPRTRRQYFPSKKQIRYFMAKAKASLNISEEAEVKLEAQAEKFKETRGDEKMLFNFKVSNQDALIPSELSMTTEEGMGDADEDLFAGTEPTQHETKPVVEAQLLNEVSNSGKILFCHQTPHQQRLMRRYSSQLILTQISDIYSKIPFPLFCLYVQTNVDFQLVGEFILQANTCSMIMEGLQTFKEWNPGWNPKFVIVDFSEEQIGAAENTFPGTFVLISDSSREKAWSDWLCLEENEVFEYKDEITQYLQAIANSYSEDMLNRAARELEESDVWKMSDKLRNWFQLNWLSQAKRWVAGYRPDDYLLLIHHGRTLEMELKNFKNIKLVNKVAPLQDVIQQIVEHVAPVAKTQYEQLNAESFKLQSRLNYMYPDIPNYLTCRPAKLTYHVYERVKLAMEQTYTLSYLHPGIFSVQCCSNGDDDILHTVSFGDANSFPSCDCLDWLVFKLPCVHLCAVFNSYPGWTWDMLSVPYKSSPVFNVDWSFLPEQSGSPDQIPGNILDKGTQTSDVSLISNSSQLSRMAKMTDPRRLAETPQVLASQCRGLLQQLTKLQLANHGRDELYRLKSNLKELIYIFSNTSKQKVSSSTTLTDTLAMQSKAPMRGKKIGNQQTQSERSPSVFQQYTSVTPKQSTDTRDVRINTSRYQTSSSQLVISKPPGEPSGSREDQENSILGTVYIVDPTKIIGTVKDKNTTQNIITTNPLQTISATPSVVKLKSIVRKRAVENPSSVFLKQQDKRLKSEMMEHDSAFPGELSLEFTPENVEDGISGNSLHGTALDEGLHGTTLLTVGEHSSIQSVGIQLEQVPLTVADTDQINVTNIVTSAIQTSDVVTSTVAIDTTDTQSNAICADETSSASVEVSGDVNVHTIGESIETTVPLQVPVETKVVVRTLSESIESVNTLDGPIEGQVVVGTQDEATEGDVVIDTLDEQVEVLGSLDGPIEDKVLTDTLVEPIDEVDSLSEPVEATSVANEPQTTSVTEVT